MTALISFDSLPRPSTTVTITITAITLLSLAYIHANRSLRPPIPTSIPWVGINPNEWFSTFRAHRREWTDAIALLTEGYNKYNKHGKPFATPNSTFEPEVLLPPEHIPWLLAQPVSVLSPFPVRDEIVGLRYLAPTVVCEDRNLHDAVLLGPLTRRLGDFTARNTDVIAATLPKAWQHGVIATSDLDGWKGVNAFGTLDKVIVKMTAVSFFGPELASDERFTKGLARHGMLVAISAGFSRLFAPPPFRFLVAPLLAMPANANGWYLRRWLLPVVRTKLEAVRHGNVVEPEAKTLLDFIVEASVDSKDERNKDPKVIASRMFLIVFAALNTTLFTLVWVLHHLASTSEHEELMQALYREGETVLAQDPAGVWTRAKLAELKVHDSVIRETLRHTGLGGRGLMHRVMKDGGVQLPSGDILQKGTWVGANVRGVHWDADLHEKPDEWYGMRYVIETAASEKVCGDEKDHQGQTIAEDAETVLERKQKSLVTTSGSFLTFSHGRHACPGRFFAAHQMKLLLAHIVLAYDIKPNPREIKLEFVSDFVVPRLNELVWVRLRLA